ncbi:hypothetical protein CR513_45231, partial [Mucuna pruriens]
MQLLLSQLRKCMGSLYGFVGERVPIRGTVELETSFGERSGTRVIRVLYTVVDAKASYNIIMGRPALNRLGAIMSTCHLCMKFPIDRKVGSVWADSYLAEKCYEDSLKVETYHTKVAVNALELDLDPRSQHEHEGPYPAEELKELTKIGSALSPEEEGMLIGFLRENRDSANDMLGIELDFICHRLLVVPGMRPVVQKKRKQGDEKCKAAREETHKLLTVGFVREVHYPTWLANVVMVRKPNGKWRMCIDYTDLNKACPKDPYPLPSIDRLVDGVAGFTLLSFMDAYSGYNQIWMHPHLNSALSSKHRLKGYGRVGLGSAIWWSWFHE